jgi:ribonuclease HI
MSRDRLFGAQYKPHKHPHTCPSLSYPEWTDAAVNSSVHLALTDALSTTQPVLTLHVLPVWDKDGQLPSYMRWCRELPNHSQLLFLIPKQKVRVHATGGAGHLPGEQPKWDMAVMATGNDAGMTSYLRWGDTARRDEALAHMANAINLQTPRGQQKVEGRGLCQLAKDLLRHTTASTGRTQQQSAKWISNWVKKKHGRRAGQAAAAAQCNTALIHADGADKTLQELRSTYSNPPPLRYDWRDITYTDGSLREGAAGTKVVGAGTYCPATDKEVLIDMRGAPEPNINIAELVGIQQALQQGATLLATDSLTSMYQIHRQLHRPQDHQYHRHRTMLEETVKTITKSDVPITILKVKSHTGVVGNELADKLAGQAALLREQDPPADKRDNGTTDICPYQDPGSSRKNMFWPVHVWKEMRTAAAGQEAREVTKSKALSNIGSALKQHMTHLLKLGTSKQDTVYFSSWRDTEEDRDPCSHHMMHSKEVTQAERSTALRYRTGTMYTAKTRHRYKQADTPNCLLCGQADGGHHTASGCPKLTKLYLSRHHKAGQAIARAIADGRHGAHLIMTDVGKYAQDTQEKPAGGTEAPDSTGKGAPAMDLTQLPHRIPMDALPRNMSQSAKQACVKHSVPDAFLYCPPRIPGEGHTYMIAEVKYCRDTDPKQQLQRARKQHRELAASLENCMKYGDRVTTVPILLGVSGGIFKKQTVNALKRLGVEGDLLNKLKYRLHRIAVKHLHWIHTTKRKKEREKEGSAQWNPGSAWTCNKRSRQQAGWGHAHKVCPSKRRRS